MKTKAPGNALVYTRRRMSTFFHKVATRTFEGSITYCSDWPRLERVNLMDRFYEHYRSGRPCGELEVNSIPEIICRCRLLRRLPHAQAVAMVHAMASAIVDLIDRARPTYLLTLFADNYVTDILIKLCRGRGIRTAEIGAGVIRNTILLSAYGEYNKARDPSAEEIDEAISSLMQKNGRVTYAIDFDGYTLRGHIRNVGFWWTRSLLYATFRSLGHCPLNFKFLVDSPRIGQGHKSLLNYPAMFYFHSDWERRIGSSTKPLLFIPLAFTPEASTDYWLHDVRFIEYERFMGELCEYLARQYQIVVKDHWAMLGQREVSFYQRLGSIPDAVMVPPAVNSRAVMERVDRVLVGAGTAGIEAALRGKRVVTLCVPYYYVEGHYLAISSADEIESLPERLEQFMPPESSVDVRRRLAARVLESTIPGNIVLTKDLNSDENCDVTSQGLRSYLKGTVGAA
jgi:hypothetical protein